VFGADIDPYGPAAYWIVCGLLIAVTVGAKLLTQSKFGLVVGADRDGDEQPADDPVGGGAVGIDIGAEHAEWCGRRDAVGAVGVGLHFWSTGGGILLALIVPTLFYVVFGTLMFRARVSGPFFAIMSLVNGGIGFDSGSCDCICMVMAMP
jgi:ABC-type branched-subunit amino acid transport system permease subunit